MKSWLTLLPLFLLLAGSAAAADKGYQVAMQLAALAPNAGGQDAYSLKVEHDNIEYSVFSNQYILAGSFPLSGATAEYRWDICGRDCWWQFFLQAGGGGSNGGPIGQITWGSAIPLVPFWWPTSAPKYVPALRLDFTTQFILIQWRAISWSYPLWIGLSVPI